MLDVDQPVHIPVHPDHRRRGLPRQRKVVELIGHQETCRARHGRQVGKGAHDDRTTRLLPLIVQGMQRHRADYMALVGAYLWLSNVSFPELSFISSQLARFVNNPGPVHYTAAIRVLLYLKNNSNRKLQYQPISTRPLRVFVDSDWATKFSVSGAVFELMGCAVHWFSKVQRSVSMSSTEAEWFATMVAAREGMYFRDLLTEFGVSLMGATAIRSDNKSVKDLSLDSIAFKKTKHILRAAHFLRDLCNRQFFQVIWIAGTQNPADLFTKVHDLSTFRAYVSLLDRLDGIE